MELSEEIRAVIKFYNLEEDQEHVIIPLPPKNGGPRRCFLLKRRFLRLIDGAGNYADFPLEEIIAAIIKYPDLNLNESMYLLHKDLDAEISKIFYNEKEMSE